jgi:hypothetical protein
MFDWMEVSMLAVSFRGALGKRFSSGHFFDKYLGATGSVTQRLAILASPLFFLRSQFILAVSRCRFAPSSH